MSDAFENMDQLFFQMVLSLQAGAMQQMGKIASPMTGKIERDLTAAKFSIDMLSMLETKMKGNLTEDESKFLEHALYELRLNYVDESKKQDPPEESETKPETEAKSQDETAKPSEETEKSD
ncbi:MAG: DUF1844 domain-containing protein [bacterium]|nr:DUF1844 domain-containing protein [bacterium]